MHAEGSEVTRIAMWSGPRNISTAMMRAFENRSDAAVVDEPFYGYYLQRSDSQHPMREQIIAAMECDWQQIAKTLNTQTPEPCGVYYLKLMTHHMLEEVDLAFTAGLHNCFLVRDPGRVIASYARVRPTFDLLDLGFPQQLKIFRYVQEQTGQRPLVLDSARVLRDPEAALTRLCMSAGIAFSEQMLNWPPGPRASDGVWAPAWYASVESSTGFEAPNEKPYALPPGCAGLYDEAMVIYRELLGE